MRFFLGGRRVAHEPQSKLLKGLERDYISDCYRGYERLLRGILWYTCRGFELSEVACLEKPPCAGRWDTQLPMAEPMPWYTLNPKPQSVNPKHPSLNPNPTP